jgi:beta-lactamase superfamily II metal-dependent hydrolase
MKKTLSNLSLIILALVAFLVWHEIAKSPSENGAEFYFFDVGQGDASLIQINDYQILIDGGPDDSVLNKLGDVMPVYDKEIEVMILSHPHADHLIGLNQVLDRYQVDKIYLSGVKIRILNLGFLMLEKILSPLKILNLNLYGRVKNIKKKTLTI